MAKAPRNEKRQQAGDPPEAPGHDMAAGTGDAPGLPPASPPADRTPRNLREDRQARVGILRNHNRAALPAPRKAQLTGRWLKMQSSRRPREAGAGPSEPSGSKEDGPRPSFAEIVENAALRQGLIALGKDGIEAIDIAGLMASVAGIGRTVPLRKPFAPVLYDDPLEGDAPVAAPSRGANGNALPEAGEPTASAFAPPEEGAATPPSAALPGSSLPGATPALRRRKAPPLILHEAPPPPPEPGGEAPGRSRSGPEAGNPAAARARLAGETQALLPDLDRRAAQEEANIALRAEQRLGSHRSRSPVGAARRMSLPPPGYRDAGWGIPENVDIEPEPAPPPAPTGWRGLVTRLIGRKR